MSIPFICAERARAFAANIGGRLIGTSFAAVTSYLATTAWVPGGSPAAKTAYTAAGVALLVYLVGSIACFWLPEPKSTRPDGIEGSQDGRGIPSLRLP